jgi:hypothetical protein
MYTPQFAVVWAEYKRTFIGLAITGLVIIIGVVLGIQGKMVAAVATLVGLLTSAFAGLAGLLMLVPWIGPLLVKALSLPLIWLMNGAGYFAAIFLARQGHGRAVVDARVLTVVLLVGLVMGYILGKIV